MCCATCRREIPASCRSLPRSGVGEYKPCVEVAHRFAAMARALLCIMQLSAKGCMAPCWYWGAPILAAAAFVSPVPCSYASYLVCRRRGLWDAKQGPAIVLAGGCTCMLAVVAFSVGLVRRALRCASGPEWTCNRLVCG